VLKQFPAGNIRVLVVWEPILPTDLAAPSTAVLARVSDPRAVQFWDQSHAVAAKLRNVPGQPQPGCCDRSGVLWDLAAVYPPGALWTDSPPPAVFFNGAVVAVRPELTDAVSRLLP